jgi:putative hydrolase
MKPLIIDTHIHTVASGHAYSTIDEIARFAKEKGLLGVAITDHSEGLPGGAHEFHFQNLRVVPKELYGVRVLTGIEANIIDYNGTIDVSENMIAHLDLVIASFHPPCIAFAEEEKITKGMIGAMQNPFVKIIGHPGDSRYPLDMERIAKAAKETRTLLEVNNASLKPGSFRPGVRENLIKLLTCCKAYEVPIVVGTDAHICYDVGEFKEAIALLEEVDFNEDLVMNTSLDKFLAYIS